MKTAKNTDKAAKQARDIRFVKDLALEYGHAITDEQAVKAIKVCKNDYYELKKYFTE